MTLCGIFLKTNQADDEVVIPAVVKIEMSKEG